MNRPPHYGAIQLPFLTETKSQVPVQRELQKSDCVRIDEYAE